jgi:hypothetical protein
MSTKDNVNCRNCEHFYTTWNKNFPYGCRSMEFVSKSLPCTEVYKLEGKICLAFAEKSIKTVIACDQLFGQKEDEEEINIIV